MVDSVMVDSSHCKPIETRKRSSMLSPIQSQPKSDELSVVFGDENGRNDSQIDFSNLTVDVDQTNKQIVVDVSMSMSLTQSMHQSLNQSLNASKGCTILDDTYVKTPDSVRLTRSTIKSPKAIDNTSEMIHTTLTAERTPIGVIRLRKVTPKIATPEISISDDEDVPYELVVVNKSQHSQMCVEHCDSVDSTKLADDSSITSPVKYPIVPTNSAIASKTTAKAHPFPFSPRIILNRINSIDEYQKNVSTQETPKMILNKAKRKPSHKKTVGTKNGKNILSVVYPFFFVFQ